MKQPGIVVSDAVEPEEVAAAVVAQIAAAVAAAALGHSLLPELPPVLADDAAHPPKPEAEPVAAAAVVAAVAEVDEHQSELEQVVDAESVVEQFEFVPAEQQSVKRAAEPFDIALAGALVSIPLPS